MTHEEICTYEVCKLAREKGFNEKCYHYYQKGVLESDECFNRYNKGVDKICSAPTQSLLQRWLREKKKIDIAIVPVYDGGYSYIVYNIHCRDNRVVNTNAGYATYELTLEDALKYALENLV